MQLSWTNSISFHVCSVPLCPCSCIGTPNGMPRGRAQVVTLEDMVENRVKGLDEKVGGLETYALCFIRSIG